MNPRDEIYARVERALASTTKRAESPYRSCDAVRTRLTSTQTDTWDLFAEQLSAVDGSPLVGFASIGPFLEAQQARFGYCDPALYQALKELDALAGITLHPELERERIDTYTFGITRASGGIAESGTVILTDADTSRRLGALAPWVHIAVLSPTHLYPDIGTALAHLPNDPSVIWATGPSKTADVEGILIKGAHGPGVQAVCLVEDRAWTGTAAG